VADVALLLSAIAGPDPRSPIAIGEPGERFAQPLDRDFRGARIAWSRDLGGLPIDPRTTATIEPQRHTFDALGCLVDEAEPDLADADANFKVLRAWSFELSSGELLQTHRDQLKDTVIWNIEAGNRLSGPDIARAVRQHTALYERMRVFMETYEFLICPVTQAPPFDVTQPYLTAINDVPMETYIDWMRSCYYISVTGHPAISVPCGFTSEGLPVGLQIVGRHQDELGVLQLAYAFEQATQLWKRRPSVVEL
jgi:amidase